MLGGSWRGPAGCRARADALRAGAGEQGPRPNSPWRELGAWHDRSSLPMPANAR